MSGAEPALTFLLQTLTNVLLDYTALKRGAKNEFQQLKNDLDRLHAFLKDAAKKCGKTALFKENEKQIRELVYEVEDTIEIYVTQTKAKNFFGRARIMMSPKMEQKVRYFRQERLANILKSMGVSESGNTTTGDGSSENLTLPPTKVREDQSNNHNNIVYLDVEEQGIIIGHLMKSSNKLDVISLTGVAGVGKTTLARMIFQDPQVMDTFKRIWIDIPQTFDKRKVLLGILSSLGNQVTSDLSDERLTRVVCSCLANEKFFLVVDDVGAVEHWEVIEEILPMTNSTGKVLLTSRETIVAASNAHVNMISQQLTPLRGEKSWELMKLEVFGDVKNYPPELEDIGQAIADSCDGLPQKIVMIARILKNQTPPLPKEWSEFSRKVGEKSIRSSTEMFNKKIAALEKPKNAEMAILDVAEVAYDKLPDDLRVCFLYTGLFPQDHEIPASTLTQLWIAERFIRPENGKSFEETAHEYLDYLVNQKLLVAEKTRLGRVKTCRVHDDIRRFCKRKAMEEHLFSVIEPPVHEVQNLYRLCFHSDPSDFLSGEQKPPHVRSFLCMLKKPLRLRKEISTTPNAFTPLRVLNCKYTKFETFPNITRLILLKHITLSIENLDSLPEKISQLTNLQTLVVDTDSRSIKVKVNIWKMMNLMHLKTKVAFILKGKRKGTAENLQTISRLSPESCSADLSKKAPNLKALGIRGELTLNHLESLSLVSFSHLEKLKLEVDILYGAPSKSSLLSLPERFPVNLKRLTLSSTYLSWNHMTLLAKILTLEVLKLKDNAFTGPLWRAYPADTFRSLQFLLIENMELVKLEASTDHFPELKCLSIKKCKHLMNVPESLAKLLEK